MKFQSDRDKEKNLALPPCPSLVFKIVALFLIMSFLYLFLQTQEHIFFSSKQY